MSLYQVLFELIDMRSFSNLWYWVMLAVMWSSSSHWILGIPFDLITRARKTGGALQYDLEQLVRINCDRMLFISSTAGLIMVAFLGFLLSTLLMLAVVYNIEFAQAVLFLVVPMSIVSMMSLRTAALIRAGDDRGEALYRRLHRQRISTQALGMLSILVTSMFGMYQNLHIGALG